MTTYRLNDDDIERQRHGNGTATLGLSIAAEKRRLLSADVSSVCCRRRVGGVLVATLCKSQVSGAAAAEALAGAAAAEERGGSRGADRRPCAATMGFRPGPVSWPSLTAATRRGRASCRLW